MLQQDLINDFLTKKVIAVAGVSRKKDIPANYIFRKFRDSGYKVYPVNPNAEMVEGVVCYPSLADLPEKPEALMLASTPSVSEILIEECAKLGIELTWMHRGVGKGSYSEKAAKKASDLGVKAITNGCPMMFLEKVDPFHRFFRWIKKF
jgi:hypothetical protein